MAKTYNVSPGKAGLARGEFSRRIIEMLTRPHTNFTNEEVSAALDANIRTVKSVRWALEHPQKVREFSIKHNKKQSMKRAAKVRAELKKLKKQGEQLDLFPPTSVETITNGATVEMLPPPPAVIHVAELATAPAADMVNSPSHYTDGGIETIDYIRVKLSREEYIGYLRGNIFKYTSRLGKKDGIAQDAGKLAWYSRELTEFLGGRK
jgi:hypothetical protein